MDLLFLLILILYFGSSLGIFVRASRYHDLSNIKWGAFVLPIITPVLIVYCAIKEKDASYLQLFRVIDILVFKLLKIMSLAKRKTNRRASQEQYDLVVALEDFKTSVGIAHSFT